MPPHPSDDDILELQDSIRQQLQLDDQHSWGWPSLGNAELKASSDILLVIDSIDMEPLSKLVPKDMLGAFGHERCWIVVTSDDEQGMGDWPNAVNCMHIGELHEITKVRRSKNRVGH